MTGPKITALDSIKVTLSMAWRLSIITLGYVIVLNWIKWPLIWIAKIGELLSGHSLLDPFFQQLSNHPAIVLGGMVVFINASILIILASVTRDTLNTASYKKFKFAPGISKLTNIKYTLLLWLVLFLIPIFCQILWHKLAPILQTLPYGDGIADSSGDITGESGVIRSVLDFALLGMPVLAKFLLWPLLNYCVLTRGLFGIRFPITHPDKYD